MINIDKKTVLFQLDNGLKVIHERRKVKTAKIRVLGRTGAFWEKDEEIGLAHFLEHMVFEGTQKYPTDELLHKQIKNIGGEFNAYTSFEHARYKVDVLKEDFEKGMDFLSQILLCPLLREKDVKKEQRIINQEYLMSINNPIDRFFHDAHKFIYEKQRYGLSITGETSHIMGITQEKLKKFYQENYNTDNLVAAIVVDYEVDKVKDLCERYLTFKKGKSSNIYEKVVKTNNGFFTRQDDSATQAILNIHYDSYDTFDKRSYYINPLNTILGSGLSSRLFNKIRQEMGLAYSVGSNFYPSVFNGSFIIHASFDENKIKDLIKAIKLELQKISSELISKEEYSKAKKLTKAGFVFDMESTTGKVNWYSMRLLCGKETKSADKLLKEKLDFTRSNILAEAKNQFRKEPTILCYSKNISESDLKSYWESV